ncbi:MAG: biotin synthase [Campylobacterales bacterium]
MAQVMLCSISNTNSGECAEDCAFCTQSAHYKSGIESFRFKDKLEVLKEARFATSLGALGFCLVTSGKGLDDKRLEYILECVELIKKENLPLHIIACNGIASKEALLELKKAGVFAYNHNLETSKEYYPNICTTMEWEDRFETCLNVKEVGLELCSGGIFGVGESEDDRKSYFEALKELNPKTSPINFYYPNSALPLGSEVISKKEALEVIQRAKEALPETIFMAAGGRNLVFESMSEAINSGFDSVVIGDYLTAKGEEVKKDLEDMKKNGINPVLNC